jgi:thiol:disulfide interchange protein DsbD
LPFVLLALAPRLVENLPRAGEWLVTLRILIGLLEVGAAIKFASNADMVLHWGVFTRQVVLVLWTALAVIGALYLLRVGRKGDVGPYPRPGALVPAAVALAVAGWLASGVGGRPLPQVEAFLPPPSTSASLASVSGVTPVWILNDYDRALVSARASGKLVFIDFTGYTCTNCRWMEANIFSRPDVGSELGQFVLARLYTDGEGEMYDRQQAFQEQKFGTVALPLYAVVGADGKAKATFSGLTRDPSEFIGFLQKARAGRVATAVLR